VSRSGTSYTDREMQRPTGYDHPAYQLDSHSPATGRAAAFGQLPCFWALMKAKEKR
jgi:hypothetical protein